MLIGSAMLSATFNLVTRVRLPLIFGTLKDGSLQINTLALNNCFSYRNIFQNGVNALSKMVLKKPGFCQKTQNFVYFGPYDFVQISPACGPNMYQIMYGETFNFQCQHLQR